MDLGLNNRVAVATGSARGLTYETIKERAVQAQPVKRVGQPRDIANAVAFRASDFASFISGEVLHVTGGRYG